MNKEKVDIRYLAGLFEGEGWAGVKNTRHKTPTCILVISMTDKEPVEAMYKFFGGAFYYKVLNIRNHNNAWIWTVSGIKAGRAAEQLLPYIQGVRKRGALQCVIDFAKTVTRPGIKLSEGTILLRKELYKLCQTYNARGDNRLIYYPEYKKPSPKVNQLALF